MSERTILIVDDNSKDREIISRGLTRSKGDPYRVLVADSGKAALECLRHETPDCILLDCALLDMDGLDLLALLKDDNDRQRFPVIMLTGADSAAKAVEAMKQGAQDYLTKNVTTAESLMRSIDNAIEKHLLRRQLQAKHEELQASQERLREVNAQLIIHGVRMQEQAAEHDHEIRK